jgi:hypothetical protein
MALKIWQFVTVVLASLLLGTTFAHLLEMPAKMKVSGPLWLTFQHNLYGAFATAGAPVELGAIATAAILAYLTRRNRRVFFLTAMAALLLMTAFAVVWVGLIRPVNVQTAGWTTETIPADWAEWRAQWEYSHTARFVLHFTAFCALLLSILSGPLLDSRKAQGGAHEVRVMSSGRARVAAPYRQSGGGSNATR